MRVLVIFEVKRKKYRLKEKKVKKVLRELFGYKSKSNFSQYEYFVPGLLQEVKGKRVAKNAFIVDEKYVRKFVYTLRKIHASVRIFYLRKRPKKK